MELPKKKKNAFLFFLLSTINMIISFVLDTSRVKFAFSLLRKILDVSIKRLVPTLNSIRCLNAAGCVFIFKGTKRWTWSFYKVSKICTFCS